MFDIKESTKVASFPKKPNASKEEANSEKEPIIRFGNDNADLERKQAITADISRMSPTSKMAAADEHDWLYCPDVQMCESADEEMESENEQI